jgi:ankyrin repeat protein
MVKTLLALGADPALGDENGKTAADWAREGGKAEVAALLESAARAPSMCQRPGPRFSS